MPGCWNWQTRGTLARHNRMRFDVSVKFIIFVTKTIMRNFTEEEIRDVVTSTKTLAEAQRKLNVNYKTFRTYAKKYDLFLPNPSGKGTFKSKVQTEKIRRTTALKYRLWREGSKEKKCELCGLEEIWNNLTITLELHHVDGNKMNNQLSNLQILCPNCHSQTDTWCGRNKKNSKRSNRHKKWRDS